MFWGAEVVGPALWAYEISWSESGSVRFPGGSFWFLVVVMSLLLSGGIGGIGRC